MKEDVPQGCVVLAVHGAVTCSEVHVYYQLYNKKLLKYLSYSSKGISGFKERDGSFSSFSR